MFPLPTVNCRIGSLEIDATQSMIAEGVNCRIGSLEIEMGHNGDYDFC